MRVLVAMSGGVDSAVAAELVLRAGHEAVGCTLLLCEGAEGDAAAAAEVCRRLRIPHVALDRRREFFSLVMRPFAEEYARGRTPNPCVTCNRTVKFGLLFDYAEAEGFDAVATGHYARTEGGRLFKAKDGAKDQSYMLYQLPQEYLSRTLMPLGDYDKDTVRKIAQEAGIHIANKGDSQDICFITDGNYADYIHANADTSSVKEGNFVDTEGNVLGTHKGIINYTVGQRKGLGIALGYPAFVKHIDA